MIRDLLAGVAEQTPSDQSTARTPKAVIAPHAAYMYSGPVAASAYARVARGRGTFERVVVIGPAHFVPLDTVATSSADTFSTPLGELAVEANARQAVLSCPGVVADDQAHAKEHSLEVHLPFLQVVLGDVDVLPLVVGQVADRGGGRRTRSCLGWSRDLGGGEHRPVPLATAVGGGPPDRLAAASSWMRSGICSNGSPTGHDGCWYSPRKRRVF
jgi:predicted class III extradiol MEMO1 family dioxygenase